MKENEREGRKEGRRRKEWSRGKRRKKTERDFWLILVRLHIIWVTESYLSFPVSFLKNIYFRFA